MPQQPRVTKGRFLLLRRHGMQEREGQGQRGQPGEGAPSRWRRAHAPPQPGQEVGLSVGVGSGCLPELHELGDHPVLKHVVDRGRPQGLQLVVVNLDWVWTGHEKALLF